MPIGDNDLASGIFFSDFGDTIVFGSQSVKANVDAPGKDSMFDSASVSNTEYRVEMAAVAMNPFPDAGDTLVISSGRFAGRYKVKSADPLDDGATIELTLRKL